MSLLSYREDGDLMRSVLMFPFTFPAFNSFIGLPGSRMTPPNTTIPSQSPILGLPFFGQPGQSLFGNLLRTFLVGGAIGGVAAGAFVVCRHCLSKVPSGEHCNKCGSPLKVTCNQCGSKVPEGNHCSQCGTKMLQIPRASICSNCRSPVDSVARFCNVCGSRTTSI